MAKRARQDYDYRAETNFSLEAKVAAIVATILIGTLYLYQVLQP